MYYKIYSHTKTFQRKAIKRFSFLFVFFVAVVDAVIAVVVMIHCSFSSSPFNALSDSFLYPHLSIAKKNLPFLIFILSNFFLWLVRSLSIRRNIVLFSQCYLKSKQFSRVRTCVYVYVLVSRYLDKKNIHIRYISSKLIRYHSDFSL